MRARDLPEFETYAASVRSALQRAAIELTRNLYGPGITLVETHDGVGVRLEMFYAQGRRSRAAVTRWSVAVPTRGMDVEASPHRSMPTRFGWQSFVDPALSISGLLVAPAALRSALFDASIERLLASLTGADDDPPELRIADDRLQLELSGWPPDAASIARGFELVVDLARRVDRAGAELAAKAGSLADHPDVAALRALRASRQRIGRAILLGFAAIVLLAMASAIGSIVLRTP